MQVLYTLRGHGQVHDPISSSNLHTWQFCVHFGQQQGLVFLDDVVLCFSDDLQTICGLLCIQYLKSDLYIFPLAPYIPAQG